MKLFEVIRNATIVQRVLFVSSIGWFLYVISVSHDRRRGFDLGNFAEGLTPIVLLWGAYWIFIGIVEKRKNK
jgi:hypothetical protein